MAEAIKKHDLRRSTLSDHFIREGRILAMNAGYPVIEKISLSATQCTSADTPKTVMRSALVPEAKAFVDIIFGIDRQQQIVS